MKIKLPFTGLRGTKRIFAILLTVVLFCAFAFAVLAAFLGGGSRKGVAVASGYCFNSNILTQYSDESQLLSYRSASETVFVTIRNYDASGRVNPTDITYTLRARLHSNKGSYYNYFVEYPAGDGTTQTTKEISGTDWTTIGSFTLSKDGAATQSFTVRFELVAGMDALPGNAAAVDLVAVPTAPAVMSSDTLGASISLGESQTGFYANGGWQENALAEDTTAAGYAGFLYRITTGGTIPSGRKEKITLTWNADLLELDKNSPLNTAEHVSETAVSGEEGSTTVTTGKLTILMSPEDAGKIYTVAFFRKNWTKTTTLKDCQVTFLEPEEISAP